MEPLSDIQALVKEHAHRAYMLAQIEKRPPGYSTNDWAVVLMDNPYYKLKARFESKVQREKARYDAEAEKDPLFAERLEATGFLPAVPATPPPTLAAKARQVYEVWLRDLVQLECENALHPLQGQPRSVEVLSEGVARVRMAMARLAENEGPLPWRPKITMNKDGTFTLRLDRDKKRPGGR